MSDLSITDIQQKKRNGNAAVSYTTICRLLQENVEFTNNAVFSHNWTGYHLIWAGSVDFSRVICNG